MRRLLYIGSGNPWKGGAGYLIRQNLFLGALAQVAELHVAMFDATTDGVPAEIKNFTPLTLPVRRRMSRLQKLKADLFDPLPRMMRGYDLSLPRSKIQSLHPEQFDAVFAFRIDFAYFAGVLEHPRLILDIDDPEHIRGMRRLMTLAVEEGDPRSIKDLEKLRRFEVAAVAGAKLAFVCQDNDLDGWEKPPEVIPNCVRLPQNPQRCVKSPMVLFVGNCAGGPASPNVDALLFFLADIWPAVLTEVPDAEFHLVGAASDIVHQAMEKTPRAQLRGFVDDLADVYAHASISIAPIRFGTGTRIKILEAFAYACPVVSTLAGAEGIEAIPGKEIELAARAPDFAKRVIDLLKDPIFAESIGQGGRALAGRKYNVVAQQKLLVARFNQFLDGKAML